MSAASRLQPILDDAQRREEDAAGALAACRVRHGAQRERLDQLHQYRAEYAGALSERGSQGMAVRELRDYGTFLARLEDAIAAEARALARLDEELAVRLEAWHAALTRSRSLAKAIEREQRAWSRRLARREQAAADEQASQRPLRNVTR